MLCTSYFKHNFLKQVPVPRLVEWIGLEMMLKTHLDHHLQEKYSLNNGVQCVDYKTLSAFIASIVLEVFHY